MTTIDSKLNFCDTITKDILKYLECDYEDVYTTFHFYEISEGAKFTLRENGKLCIEPIQTYIFCNFNDIKYIIKSYHGGGRLLIIKKDEYSKYSKAIKKYLSDKQDKIYIIEKHKDFIENFINTDRYEKVGIDISRGLILSGPPGCGKTQIINYIKNKYSSAYYTDKDLTDFNRLCKTIEAPKHPTDEGYSVFGYKIANKPIELYDDINIRIFQEDYPNYNSMLSWLDNGKKKIRILSTNECTKRMSPAMRRPGRFNEVLIIGPPDKDERLKFFKDFDENLVDRTEGMTYAEMQYLKVCVLDADMNIDAGLKRFYLERSDTPKEAARVHGFSIGE